MQTLNKIKERSVFPIIIFYLVQLLGSLIISHQCFSELLKYSYLPNQTSTVDQLSVAHIRCEKMDITDTTKNLLRPLGYLERNPSEGKYINIVRRIFCSISCLFISLPAFWCIFFEIEAFSEKTKAVMAFICGFTNFVFYVIMLWQRRHILDMFMKLQDFVRARENISLTRIYKKANQSYAKLVRIAKICIFQISAPSFIFPSLVQSFIEYYVLHRAEKSFRLAFHVS